MIKELTCKCGGRMILVKERKIFNNKYGIFCEFFRCVKCKDEFFDEKQLHILADRFDNLLKEKPILLQIPTKKSFLLI